VAQGRREAFESPRRQHLGPNQQGHGAAGSGFKGQETYQVQELVLSAHAIGYLRERWVTPHGRTIVVPLPVGTKDHFRPDLRRFELMQYYQGQTTQPRLTALLHSVDVDLSARDPAAVDREAGRVSRGKRDVLRAGLGTSYHAGHRLPIPEQGIRVANCSSVMSSEPAGAKAGPNSGVLRRNPGPAPRSHPIDQRRIRAGQRYNYRTSAPPWGPPSNIRLADSARAAIPGLARDSRSAGYRRSHCERRPHSRRPSLLALTAGVVKTGDHGGGVRPGCARRDRSSSPYSSLL
jgi:hypothetical protein